MKSLICGALLRLFGIFLLCLPGLVYAQEEPPVVSVAFCLEADVYRDNMPEALAQVEEAAALYAAGLFMQVPSFSYVRWAAGTCTAPAAEAAAAVVVRVVQTPEGDVHLTFTAGDNDLTFSNPKAFHPLLFNWFDDPFAHDPEGLKKQIRRLLDGQIASEVFQKAFEETVLQNVPLSQQVELLPDANRLTIPLRYAALRAAPESTFHVRFEAAAPGNIKARLEGDVFTGDDRILQCSTFEFRYPGHDYFNPVDISTNWAAIRQLLHTPASMRAEVFMRDYIYNFNPGTCGGLVCDPGL